MKEKGKKEKFIENETKDISQEKECINIPIIYKQEETGQNYRGQLKKNITEKQQWWKQ